MQRGTTSSEFAEWCRYFELELEEPTREEYYLAQIAAVVASANAKKGTRIRLEDYILKWRTTKQEQSQESILQRSKQAWMAVVFGRKKEE